MLTIKVQQQTDVYFPISCPVGRIHLHNLPQYASWKQVSCSGTKNGAMFKKAVKVE
jgi:hypothetical protein